MKQWRIKHVKRSLVASLFATLITFLLLFAQVAQAAASSSWKVVPSPSPGSSANQLVAIEAVSAGTLWAVGSFSNTTGPSRTLTELYG